MSVVPQPTIFLRIGRPVSANKTIPEKYRNDLRAAYLGAGGTRQEGDSYGLVYWFVRRYDPTNHPDADNISKPVWDALEGVAYGDDKSDASLPWPDTRRKVDAGPVTIDALQLPYIGLHILTDLDTGAYAVRARSKAPDWVVGHVP